MKVGYFLFFIIQETVLSFFQLKFSELSITRSKPKHLRHSKMGHIRWCLASRSLCELCLLAQMLVHQGPQRSLKTILLPWVKGSSSKKSILVFQHLVHLFRVLSISEIQSLLATCDKNFTGEPDLFNWKNLKAGANQSILVINATEVCSQKGEDHFSHLESFKFV